MLGDRFGRPRLLSVNSALHEGQQKPFFAFDFVLQYWCRKHLPLGRLATPFIHGCGLSSETITVDEFVSIFTFFGLGFFHGCNDGEVTN